MVDNFPECRRVPQRDRLHDPIMFIWLILSRKTREHLSISRLVRPGSILLVLGAECSGRLTTGLVYPGSILSVPLAEWSGRLTTDLVYPGSILSVPLAEWSRRLATSLVYPGYTMVRLNGPRRHSRVRLVNDKELRARIFIRFTNFAPRSQSTRDILRQGAKLHEMQEEVRRRKIDRDVQGVVTSPQHYAHQPVNSRPQSYSPNNINMVQNNSSHRLLSSNNQFTNQDQPNHHGPMAPQSPGFPQTHPMNSLYAGSRPQGNYAPPTAPKPTRQPVPQDIQRLPFSPESRHSTHPELHQGPLRPPMPPDELGYRDSPPPPPPPTSTHPLYQSSQKAPPQTGIHRSFLCGEEVTQTPQPSRSSVRSFSRYS
uniref:Uncharacterized protein n=1 Tax=Timema tahoe TaxID=61484 RepID=A0A7R9IEE2_9NEOP|nr:unnamed protein product [Timema tahoe]